MTGDGGRRGNCQAVWTSKEEGQGDRDEAKLELELGLINGREGGREKKMKGKKEKKRRSSLFLPGTDQLRGSTMRRTGQW